MQRDTAQLPGEALPAAAQTDYRGVEERAKTGCLDTLAFDRSAGKHHNLDQVAAEQTLFGGKGSQTLEPLQQTHPGDIARENQLVAGPDNLLGRDRRNKPLTAHDLDQKQSVQFAQSVIGNAAIDQRRAVHDLGLDQVFGDDNRFALAMGQQPRSAQDRHKPGGGGRQADGQKIEECQALAPRVFEKRTDDEIGRGADQGHGATEHRRVRQRQQQAAGRMMGIVAQRVGQGRDHGGVIDQRREQPRDQGDTQQGPAIAAGHQYARQARQPTEFFQTDRHEDH